MSEGVGLVVKGGVQLVILPLAVFYDFRYVAMACVMVFRNGTEAVGGVALFVAAVSFFVYGGIGAAVAPCHVFRYDGAACEFFLGVGVVAFSEFLSACVCEGGLVRKAFVQYVFCMVTGGADAVGTAVVVFCGCYFGVAVVFSFVAVVVAVLIGVACFYMKAVVRVSVLYDHSAHVVVSSGRVGAAAAQGVVDFNGVACRTVDAFQVVDRTVHAVSYFYLPVPSFFDYVGVAVVVHVYPSDLAVIDGVVYAGVRVEDGLEDP